MLWICRAGKNSIYINKYIAEQAIYLCWENIDCDLSQCDSKKQFYEIEIEEMGATNKTIISTGGTQIKYIANEMNIGDYVLIPHKNNELYVFGIIQGNYEFISDTNLNHKRNISIILSSIPKKYLIKS